MSQMIGADVEALKSLSRSMDSSAQRLTEIGSALRATSRTTWKGTDAQSFFSDVDSSLLVQLNSVAEALLAARDSLTRNAQDQEQTSSTLDGGGVSPHSSSTGSGSSEGLSASEIAEIVADGGRLLLDGIGYAVDVAELGKIAQLGNVGSSALIVGSVVAGAAEAWEYSQSGDPLRAAYTVIKTGTPLLAGPWAPAVSAAYELFEMGIPIGAERQDAVLEAYKIRTYGTTELTLEQEQAVAARYTEGAGFFNMIGDSFAESVENPTGFVSHGVTFGVEVSEAINSLWGK